MRRLRPDRPSTAPRLSRVAAEEQLPGSSPSWSGAIRTAPLGVLVLGALLFLVGSGFVLGGAYLALTAAPLRWVGWALALAVGPLLLYFALHLVRRSPWSWLAAMLCLTLLLLSTLVRFYLVGGLSLPLGAELAMELLFLAYLARARIRRAFGRR